MEILDFAVFMTDGKLTESDFFEKVNEFDWEGFRDKPVLVRGCGTAIVPPWAFMVVASRLAQVAKRVRYGSEHSSVTVFSRSI
jgi:hypothetical protein